MKISILTSSEDKGLELAGKFQDFFKSSGVESDLINIIDLSLPLYTSRAEKEHAPEAIVAPFKARLNADGYVFLAPEYNGGIAPAFSNFLAWVSRSTKNWRETFNNKSAVIATHSGGGQNVLHMMRLQLSYIGMHVIGRQIHTNPHKALTENELKAVCEELIRLSSR